MRHVLFSLVLLLSLPAVASPLAPEHLIEPFVQRADYQAYCREVGVESDQQQIANMLYEDYVQQLVDLQAASEVRATEAGADRLTAVYEGRGFMGSEELRATRIAVQRSYMENWPVADQLYAELVSDTAAMSIDASNVDMDRARGDLQRRVVLEYVRRREQDRTYAGDGLDVLVLVEHAGVQEAPQMKEVLVQYADRVNLLVARHAAANRASVIKERVAKISKDSEESISLMRSRVDRWKNLNQLNEWAIESVAYVLESQQGAESAQAWRVKARMARFPWLYKPDNVELVSDWVFRNGDAQQQEKTRVVLEAYLPRRDELRAEFEQLLLSARTDHGVILGDSALEKDPDSQEIRGAHLRLTGELRLLESRTTEQVEANLTSGQRAAARRSAID